MVRPFQQWIVPSGGRVNDPPWRLVVDSTGVAVAVELSGDRAAVWEVSGWRRGRTDPDREVGRRRSRSETTLELADGSEVALLDHDCCAGCGKCGRGSGAAALTTAQVVALAQQQPA